MNDLTGRMDGDGSQNNIGNMNPSSSWDGEWRSSFATPPGEGNANDNVFNLDGENNVIDDDRENFLENSDGENNVIDDDRENFFENSEPEDDVADGSGSQPTEDLGGGQDEYMVDVGDGDVNFDEYREPRAIGGGQDGNMVDVGDGGINGLNGDGNANVFNLGGEVNGNEHENDDRNFDDGEGNGNDDGDDYDDENFDDNGELPPGQSTEAFYDVVYHKDGKLYVNVNSSPREIGQLYMPPSASQ